MLNIQHNQHNLYYTKQMYNNYLDGKNMLVESFLGSTSQVNFVACVLVEEYL